MIMSKSSDRMEKFGEICDRMLELHRGKDAMYGSSFEDGMEEFGVVSSLVRLNDKMNRLKSLYRSSVASGVDFVGMGGYGESVRDTLIDLANYAVMTLAYLEGKDSEVKSKGE